MYRAYYYVCGTCQWLSEEEGCGQRIMCVTSTKTENIMVNITLIHRVEQAVNRENEAYGISDEFHPAVDAGWKSFSPSIVDSLQQTHSALC